MCRFRHTFHLTVFFCTKLFSFWFTREFCRHKSPQDTCVIIWQLCRSSHTLHFDSSGHTQHTQHNTTQHNTTQHNTTQHNTTQHNTTQHNTTQHNTTQHNTTQHNTTQHNTTQHNTTQHNTTQHNTTQHNTTQHNTLLCPRHHHSPEPLPQAISNLS